MPSENNFVIFDSDIGTCINAGGLPVPVSIPRTATTEGENSEQPDTLVTKCITRKKPYFVMMPYYRSDDVSRTRAFVAAANFKKERLQRLYPDALIEVKLITTADDFKTTWNAIGTFITNSNEQYYLKEVHYFGHSDYNNLYLLGQISYDDVTQLQQLPWSVGGTFALHSCQSSRFEEQNEEGVLAKKCIANAFSRAHDVRVIGQVVYATNNTGDTVDDFKYRNRSLTNWFLVDLVDVNNVVLWGYRAGSSSEKFASDPEYKQLSNFQIWPCRVFSNGVDFPRAVAKDTFNHFDLTYI